MGRLSVSTPTETPAIQDPISGSLLARLRKGTRRRLASNVALACTALHMLFSCTATVLGHVIGPYREFAVDVAATFRPMVERPDLLEVFGGHASTTERASYHGLTALRPRGYIYGDDLKDPRVRELLLHEIRFAQPRVVLIGWPCRYWGCSYEYQLSWASRQAATTPASPTRDALLAPH